MNPQMPYGAGHPEGIDIDKLRQVARKNIWLILIILFTANLAAYLTIRWTKDVFEASAELKLEMKHDATALGIPQLQEDQNRNLLAGEIEQMKSEVFFGRVLDSMDLWISYYSVGNVLEFELYPGSPFRIEHADLDPKILDRRIYFDFLEGNRYIIRLEDGKEYEASLGEPMALGSGVIRASLNPGAVPDFKNHFFFVINSRTSLLDYLSKSLVISPINFDANTIKVSFTDHNSFKVANVVNKVVSTYLSYSNEQKNRANKQKIDWLNKELQQVEMKMENFENYFEAFTLKNKSSNLESDLKKTIYLLNQVDSQRYELNKKITEISALMDNISAGKLQNTVVPSGYLPQYVNTRMEELQRLIHDQNKLTLSYKDNTYAYQQKEQEVTNLKKSVFNQLSEIRKNWMNAMAELNQKKDRLEKDFATMPDRTTQYSKNQRFYKLYEEFYLSMMQSKAEFEIAQAGSIPDFRILASATIPSEPIAPKKYLILGIGFVGGLVINFFLIGLLYLLNNKISGLKEIERATNAPILGVIPEMRRHSAGPFYILENPRSVVSEAIRTLRTNLDFFASTKSQKVIAISSTVSGEGKSFLAMNLGGVLALSKKRVILLDLDMRKVKQNGHFKGEDPSKGVSTLLIHRSALEESICHTSMEGFDFIPSGPHPPNPSELLLNGEFEGLLDDLKKKYDYIVIDTPPVGLVTDGIMAMKKADLSIYVVRANYSKRDFLSNLDRISGINKLQNIAVVLNALPTSGKTYGYGYYQEDGQRTNRLSKLFRG